MYSWCPTIVIEQCVPNIELVYARFVLSLWSNLEELHGREVYDTLP